jgi:hypothetical protein
MMSEEKKTEEVVEEKKTPEEEAKGSCEGGTCESGTCKDGVCEGGSCEGKTCGDVCCGIQGGKNIFIWLVIVVLAVGAIAYFQMQKRDNVGEERPVKEKVAQEVRDNAMKMITGQLVPEGTKVEIGKITEESGLYKMIITVEGQEVTSYMSKDMTKFIPQLVDTKQLEEKSAEEDATTTETTEVQTKSDKPEVEIFVMSHCPYGTQIEKGILPVLKALGTTVNAKFKFVDYAMHGEKEVKEELRQYCIQEKEPQKFHAYLGCFLEKQDEKACMQTALVNQTLLAQCVAQTDKAFKVTELFNDKSSWVSGQFPQFNISKADNEKYGVQGSPTLVINGELIQSGRDSASLMKAICSAFNTQPAACQTEMSSDAPAPGFGSGTAAAANANTTADCGA